MTGTKRPPSEPAEADTGEDTPLEEVSDLHRMAAPQNFEAALTETIRKRSGGRFFGRKSVADRVPFLWLAVAALVIGLVVFLLVRASDTGSLRYQKKPTGPAPNPEASEQMPSPYRQ